MESLSQLRRMPTASGVNEQLQREAGLLADEIAGAIRFGIVRHQELGNVMAYEINGLGSYHLMDDANVPSLLSLPYLVKQPLTDYQRTRRLVLSKSNPFFYKGSAGEGIGGPHAGENMIWPLSIIMRGLTSHDDKEIKFCLDMLQKCHAGTGFMHESFHKDDASRFTRKWFAWANTLFGEFVLKVYEERPHLLT
jgi:meiotically up-regulated gene 157 (Mug157) protein